jgi:hypothetical protein
MSQLPVIYPEFTVRQCGWRTVKKQELHTYSGAHVSLHPPEFCNSVGGVNVHLGGVGGSEIYAASTSTQPLDFWAVYACKPIEIFHRSYGLPP